MAKSAKTNSVFGDVAVSLIPEGKREKKRDPIELPEEEVVAQPAETTNTTINTNNTQEPHAAAGNSGFSIKPVQKEAKSKRVNLVLQPSVYAKAVKFAKRNGVSFNEMISQLLQQLD